MEEKVNIMHDHDQKPEPKSLSPSSFKPPARYKHSTASQCPNSHSNWNEEIHNDLGKEEYEIKVEEGQPNLNSVQNDQVLDKQI